MKKTLLLLILFPLLTLADEDFMSVFVQGNYVLVGKGLESDTTYHGKVAIQEADGRLVVKRHINGQTLVGSAVIEPALGGDAKVLRIRFTENTINYEQTCLLASDLDNYARISCYLYRPDTETHRPGLEVLFRDHSE